MTELKTLKDINVLKQSCFLFTEGAKIQRGELKKEVFKWL